MANPNPHLLWPEFLHTVDVSDECLFLEYMERGLHIGARETGKESKII